MFFSHGDAVVAKDQQALPAPIAARNDRRQPKTVGSQKCPFDLPQSIHR
jgi:hypothetical protein